MLLLTQQKFLKTQRGELMETGKNTLFILFVICVLVLVLGKIFKGLVEIIFIAFIIIVLDKIFGSHITKWWRTTKAHRFLVNNLSKLFNK
jgi:uncharacterized membrane protein required for colicin V production